MRFVRQVHQRLQPMIADASPASRGDTVTGGAYAPSSPRQLENAKQRPEKRSAVMCSPTIVKNSDAIGSRLNSNHSELKTCPRSRTSPTTSTRARSVRFNPSVDVMLVGSREDLDPETIHWLWWTDDDVHHFREVAMIHFQKHGKDNNSISEEELAEKPLSLSSTSLPNACRPPFGMPEYVPKTPGRSAAAKFNAIALLEALAIPPAAHRTTVRRGRRQRRVMFRRTWTAAAAAAFAEESRAAEALAPVSTRQASTATSDVKKIAAGSGSIAEDLETIWEGPSGGSDGIFRLSEQKQDADKLQAGQDPAWRAFKPPAVGAIPISVVKSTATVTNNSIESTETCSLAQVTTNLPTTASVAVGTNARKVLGGMGRMIHGVVVDAASSYMGSTSIKLAAVSSSVPAESLKEGLARPLPPPPSCTSVEKTAGGGRLFVALQRGCVAKIRAKCIRSRSSGEQQ